MAKWLCWLKKVIDSDTKRNPMCRFIVQSSHHRGPQHGVFSSSPFWFSVFTDSVSLAGTLAVASNKAAYLKNIIKLCALCNGRTFFRKVQHMLPIRSNCKKCSHCINKNADAQETYKQREFKIFFQVNENCMTVILISKATVQSQSYLNERNVLSSTALHHCHHQYHLPSGESELTWVRRVDSCYVRADWCRQRGAERRREPREEDRAL